jgi:glycosyltransferase involved in cell wall biosynthesis
MPTAAVFTSTFLQYSQTFIHEELRNHRRWSAEVFTGRRVHPERFAYEPVHVGGRLYSLTTVSRRFHALFSERRYDLVHGHFGPAGVHAMHYARRFRLPLVVTFHGYDVPLLRSRERFAPEWWGYALLGPLMLRSLSMALCASSELREMVIGLGVPPGCAVTHRLGVDLERFRAGMRHSERPQVTMVGRFVEKKGFEYGLSAFARVADRHPSARLTLVGDGELKAALEAQVRAQGHSARVTFAGPLAAPDVAALLARTDVLLAPSVVTANGNRESGLIVVKEASACEAVPVGTLHGGIPEMIDDGVTGFLVPERDVDAMAERLDLLLGDAELRTRMGRAARAKMEREYDNRERVAELELRYDEACAKHTASRR